METPTIGIFTQPIPNPDVPPGISYLSSDYVKWIESGGAKVLPIPFQFFKTDSNKTNELYDHLFAQINGLVLPGGDGDLESMWQGMGYLTTKALESNLNGDYFPIWGTCQGFELLVSYVGGSYTQSVKNPGNSSNNDSGSILTSGYDAENYAWPLESVAMKELFPDESAVDDAMLHNITFNLHTYGITPTNFENNSYLTDLWQVTSTNVGANGQPFVSTIEPIDPESFPVYATQWHPEKNEFQYDLKPNSTEPFWNIPHSLEAVRLSTRLSQFFVEKARNNLAMGLHKYDDINCPLVYEYTEEMVSGLFSGHGFQQVYMFYEGDKCGFGPAPDWWVAATSPPSSQGNDCKVKTSELSSAALSFGSSVESLSLFGWLVAILWARKMLP